MTDETIDKILKLLNGVQDILTKELDPPHPDEMDVSEWNATPVGRAVGLLGDACDMLTE